MVSVKPIDAPASVTLPDELPAVDVLILPREVSDGRGLYDDSVVTLGEAGPRCRAECRLPARRQLAHVDR